MEMQKGNISENGVKQLSPLIQSTTRTYKSAARITAIIINVCLSSFYFGYCIVYLGGIPTDTLKQVFSISLSTGVTEGLLNGCVPLGALAGALTSGYFIQRFSRRECLLIFNGAATAIGCVLFIPTFPTLIISRLGQGYCVGFFSAIAPLIVKEMAPVEIAGTMGTIVQINVVIGVSFGLFFTYCLKKITGDNTCKDFWFLVFGFPLITIAIQTLLLIFVFPYQTPKYLLSMGKEQQARELLQVIYLPEKVEEVMEEKKKDLRGKDEEEEEKEGEVKVPVKDHKVAVVVALHLAAMQQLSGVNAIAVYGGKIAGQVTTGELKELAPTLVNFIQLFSGLMVSYIVTRFGRRIVLVLGPLVVGVATAIVMVGFLINQSGMVVGGLFMFMFFFGMSLGPVVWLYIPEIVQSRVIPFSTAANWITASLVIILFPIITQNILDGNPGRLFIFFTIWCMGSTIFDYFFVLQTNGKTQKTIRDQYGKIKFCL